MNHSSLDFMQNHDEGFDLSKALTAPSVMTKPVFFMVEYSSMLLILIGHDKDADSEENIVFMMVKIIQKVQMFHNFPFSVFQYI